VFFSLLKLFASFAIRIYCRKIIVNKPEWLHAKGPLLFAANHPNSFLDGIILTTLMKEHLYSLARGDVFRKSRVKRLLYKLHLLPVYRTSEGVENLAHNYTTFSACHRVFQDQGIVMIFSEGRCINEWHLRPLKKGTARLAISSWEKGINLTVVPVGFNYNRFRNFGKNVFINFGQPLDKTSIMGEPSDGRQMLAFNEQLKSQLETLVYEIDSDDYEGLQQVYVPLPLLKKLLLAPFALLGWLASAPLYYGAKAVNKKLFNNDHFDSVMVAFLFFAYPVYLLVIVAIAAIWTGPAIASGLFLLLLFGAYAAVQVKDQLKP
jgi:1-acyl-sn-glycerol-3-phosphate acyltransferase